MLGHYDSGMRTRHVTAFGKYLYVVSHPEEPQYPSKLDIYRITKEVLQKVGTYISDYPIADIVVSDKIAFLSAGYPCSGVEVIDLSDPTNPTKISTYQYDEPTGVGDLIYDEEKKIIYLCCDYYGLIILDASDPYNLTRIGRVSHFDGWGYMATDVYINNGIAYVVDGNMFGGFGMIDVSDPWNPHALTYIPLGLMVHGIQVQDDLVYLVCEFPMLLIIDVSNYTSPILMGSYYENNWASGSFQIKDDICYIVEWFNLTLIDTHNVSSPLNLLFIPSPPDGLFKDVYIDASLIFLACAWGGVEVWQLPIILDWTTSILYIALSLLGFSFVFIVTIVIWRKRKKID